MDDPTSAAESPAERTRGRTWPYVGVVLLAVVACVALVWRVAAHLEHSAPASAEVSRGETSAPGAEEGSEPIAAGGVGGGPLVASSLSAAVVGATEIRASDLALALEHLEQSARARGEAVDWRWREAQRARLLEERIAALLLEQHLAARAEALPAERIAVALDALIAARFQGRREQLERYLTASGRTMAGVERELRLEVALLDAVGGEAAMAVDAAALEATWREHRGLFQAPSRARVEVFALRPRTPDDAGWRELGALSRDVHEALTDARSDAHALARRHGLELTIDARGFVMAGELPAPLDEALFGSAEAPPAGAVLGPLVHDGRMWLARVRDWRPAGERGLDEVEAVVAAQARQQRLASARRELVERLGQVEGAVVRYDGRWYRKLQRRIAGH